MLGLGSELGLGSGVRVRVSRVSRVSVSLGLGRGFRVRVSDSC